MDMYADKVVVFFYCLCKRPHGHFSALLVYKEGGSPLFIYSFMATPQQVQSFGPPATPIYDPSPANPFIAQPNTWDTDDVADSRTLAYLRRKIDRVRFLLDHPPTASGDWPDHVIINLQRDLDRWVLLLNKAHYN